MKTTYIKPMMAVVQIGTTPILTGFLIVSGNFIEADTDIEGVYPDKPIDGGDAWSKPHKYVWGDEDEEE